MRRTEEREIEGGRDRLAGIDEGRGERDKRIDESR